MGAPVPRGAALGCAGCGPIPGCEPVSGLPGLDSSTFLPPSLTPHTFMNSRMDGFQTALDTRMALDRRPRADDKDPKLAAAREKANAVRKEKANW